MSKSKVEGLVSTARLFVEDIKKQCRNQTMILQQPDLFKSKKMKDFQIVGLNWLMNLNKLNMNGILADEMGCGKTIQTIALLAMLKQQKMIASPSLIVVPLSTIDNWKNEFEQCYPNANVVQLMATKEEREKSVEKIKKGYDGIDVILTTYEGVNLTSYLKRIELEYVIIDEAHRIKNSECLLSFNMKKLDCKHKLLLTGTPLQNNLLELWSLLNFIMPNLFSSKEVFAEYLKDADNENRNKMIENLKNIIRPFLLRRNKRDVLKDLPEKSEQIVYCQMTQMQTQEYIKVIQGYDIENNKLVNMNKLMELRKVCQHPYLIEGVEDNSLPIYGEHLIETSGKMIILDQLIRKIKQNKEKVLVFSQFKIVLDIIQDYCDYKEYGYYRLDGEIDIDQRNQDISDFNQSLRRSKGKKKRDGNNDKFIYMLTSRAGGLGINLQAANNVILYDIDWNPQIDLQAIGRAHRIGQEKEVNVYRLVAEHTIEEKMYERQMIKMKLDLLMIQNIDVEMKFNKKDVNQIITYKNDMLIDNKEQIVTDLEQVIKKSSELDKIQQQKINQIFDQSSILNVQDQSIDLEKHFMDQFYQQKQKEVDAFNKLRFMKQNQEVVQTRRREVVQNNQQTNKNMGVITKNFISKHYKQGFPEHRLYSNDVFELYLKAHGYKRLDQNNFSSVEGDEAAFKELEIVKQQNQQWTYDDVMNLLKELQEKYLQQNDGIDETIGKSYDQIVQYWNDCIEYVNKEGFSSKQLRQQYNKALYCQTQFEKHFNINQLFKKYKQSNYRIEDIQNGKLKDLQKIHIKKMIEYVEKEGSEQLQSIRYRMNNDPIMKMNMLNCMMKDQQFIDIIQNIAEQISQVFQVYLFKYSRTKKSKLQLWKVKMIMQGIKRRLRKPSQIKSTNIQLDPNEYLQSQQSWTVSHSDKVAIMIDVIFQHFLAVFRFNLVHCFLQIIQNIFDSFFECFSSISFTLLDCFLDISFPLVLDFLHFPLTFVVFLVHFEHLLNVSIIQLLL